MGLVIELHFISSIHPETKTAHVVSAVSTIDIGRLLTRGLVRCLIIMLTVVFYRSVFFILSIRK